MNFRKALIVESMGVGTHPLDDIDLDQDFVSEVATDEATRLVEEHEEFVDDAELAMAIDIAKTEANDGYGQSARDLVVENFKAKWGIRTLTSESIAPHGGYDDPTEKTESKKKGWFADLWERFVTWLDGFIKSIVDGWKRFTAVSKKYTKIQQKLADRLKALGNNPTQKKKVSISYSSDLARMCWIDNKPIGVMMALDLPDHVKEITSDLSNWMTNHVTDSLPYIKLSESGGKFTREGYSQLERIKGTNFFKKTAKKLKKIGPKDSAEEQFIIPLIGNDYLQCFSYVNKVEGNSDCVVNGVRYIKGEHARVEANNIPWAKDLKATAAAFTAIPIPTLIQANSKLKGLIDNLKSVEDRYRKVKDDISKMRDESKALSKQLKNKSLDANVLANLKSAHRVSRESVFTAQHTYNFCYNLSRNAVVLVAGVINLSTKCYE